MDAFLAGNSIDLEIMLDDVDLRAVIIIGDFGHDDDPPREFVSVAFLDFRKFEHPQRHLVSLMLRADLRVGSGNHDAAYLC